jgi:hypothetical protein
MGLTRSKPPLCAPQTTASATDWSWLSNKNYIHCLQLFSTGNFLIPPNASPAQIAAKHEQGRLYCNKQYGY